MSLLGRHVGSMFDEDRNSEPRAALGRREETHTNSQP